jgi:predicted transcriptional regulator
MGLIGLFLCGAARGSYSQVVLRQLLQGQPVRRFMNPRPITVSPSWSLRQWLEEAVYPSRRKAFPVTAAGAVVGFVNTDALAKVPRGDWDRHTVAEVMRTDLAAVTIAPNADAWQALQRVQQSDFSLLLVTERGLLVGVLSLTDLLRLVTLELELEGDDAPGADDRLPPRPLPREDLERRHQHT